MKTAANRAAATTATTLICASPPRPTSVTGNRELSARAGVTVFATRQRVVIPDLSVGASPHQIGDDTNAVLACRHPPVQTRCMPQRRRPQFPAAMTVAALTLPTLVAGCGDAEVVTADDVTVLIGEQTQEGMDALLPGRLAVLDGCLGLESDEVDASYVVIWPHGTRVVGKNPLTISIPDDGEYSIGDQIQIAGGEAITSGNPGGVDVKAECPSTAVWLGHT